MRRLRTFLFAIPVALILLSGLAHADIPLPTYFEIDLDNWTRLYDAQGVPIPIGNAPALGQESQAILTFNQLGPTVGPGGTDLPATWVGGISDGTYLHGWESNVVISQIVVQGDGSLNIYFDHVTNDPNNARYWEFYSYATTMSTANLVTNELSLGAANIDTIMADIAAAGVTDFMRGRFSYSDYNDPVAGLVTALVGIHIPQTNLNGNWLDQIQTPFSLGINAFIDVDPTWGQGFQAFQGFYGSHPGTGDPYDLAIQNVNLNSELNPQWVISDDGIRGAAAVPEPTTILLLGAGLLGLAGFARMKKN